MAGGANQALHHVSLGTRLPSAPYGNGFWAFLACGSPKQDRHRDTALADPRPTRRFAGMRFCEHMPMQAKI